MRYLGILLAGMALSLAVGCGGGRAVKPAHELQYTDPTDVTGWRLVSDPSNGTSSSTPLTHLVLDLLAPAGTTGQGVTLTLNGDSSEAACTLVSDAYSAYDTSYNATNSTSFATLVRVAKTEDSATSVVVAQGQGAPVVPYGSQPVLQLALDLAPGATVRTVQFSATAAAHLLSIPSNPASITIATGTLEAQ